MLQLEEGKSLLSAGDKKPSAETSRNLVQPSQILTDKRKSNPPLSTKSACLPPSRFKRIMATKDPIPSPAQGVGPVYRPDGEKPTATVSKEVSYENVHVLSQTPQLIALLT